MSSLQDGQSLEEDFFPTDIARAHRWFPWLRMLRVFRVSVDYRMLLVSLLGLFLWRAGDLGLQRLAHRIGVELLMGDAVDQGWKPSLSRVPAPVLTSRLFWGALENPERAIQRASSRILWPLRIASERAGFLLEAPQSWKNFFFQWLSLLWTLTVLGTTGGILSRIAAIELSSAGSTLSGSVQLARKHFLSYLGAPLTTLVGFGGLSIALVIAGWVARIPVLGEALVGAFWFLAIIFGVFLALIVVGVVTGWPLMICAVSVEDSDAFDGLSRAFTYVFNRPWYLLFLAGFAIFYGTVLLCFVEGIIQLSVSLSMNFTGVQSMTSLAIAPRSTLTLRDHFILFWTNMAYTMPLVWGGSFFWSAMTVIYVLLRRREDGTPVNEVAGVGSSRPDSGPPLVGIPAAIQRELKAAQELGGSNGSA